MARCPMNILDLIVGPVMKIVDKLVPDPAAKAAMQLQVLQLNQAGEFKDLDDQLQRDLAQIDVNKAEASTDLFRGGWRPFIGWVSGVGLAYQYILRPLVIGFTSMPFPELGLETLMPLMFGMLGLGAYRTAEKIKGGK